MSNLGLYQDIVMQAKRVGGVDALVRNVADTAVRKAAPGLVGTGVAVGVGLTVAATVGARHWRGVRERAANAQAALVERLSRDGTDVQGGDDGRDGARLDALE